MKALLLPALLLPILGLAQPSVAAPFGVWGCPAATLSSSATNQINAQVRVWNLGDGGTVTIQGVRIYDASGTSLHPVTSVAVQLGPHQATIIQVRQLLGLPFDAPTINGLQVVVEWQATSAARPWAEAIRTSWARDPLTGAVTGMLSSDSIGCLELK